MKPCSRVCMDNRDLGPVYASVTLSTCVDSYPCLVPLVMTHIFAINDGGSGQQKKCRCKQSNSDPKINIRVPGTVLGLTALQELIHCKHMWNVTVPLFDPF